MKKQNVNKQDVQLSNYKVLKRQHYIETFDTSNQLIHFIDLSYIKAEIFFHGWVGYRTSDQIKSIYSGHFVEVFTENPCRCMLTDCSRMRGDLGDTIPWYNSNINPVLMDLGLEYNAIILPADNLAQISVREWQKKSENYKNVTFNSLNDAINWLALL